MRFSDPVLERVRSPTHVGRLDTDRADVVEGRGHGDPCPDVVYVYLRFRDDGVAEARFRAHGCPVAVASGSYVASAVEGRRIAELAAIDVSAISKALEVGPERKPCVEVAIAALEDAIRRRDQTPR